MLFALLLPTRLNKIYCLNIIYETLLNQATITDLDFNTSILSSNTSTYREKKIESILGYINEDVIVCTT